MQGLLGAFRYQNATQWGYPTDWFAFGERGSILPDGYGITLPQSIDKNTFSHVFKTLSDLNWVDKATRRVLVEATFYNPKLMRIAVMQFLMDVSVSGLVYSHVDCNTVKAQTSITDSDGGVEIVLQASSWRDPCWRDH